LLNHRDIAKGGNTVYSKLD